VINQVGIKDILHPINFVNRDNESHPSVANFTMTVRLPENVKGTHMSRFIEILNDNECSFGIDNFMDLVQTVADKLESNDAQIIVDFPFFRNKKAPSSGVESLLDYKATLTGSLTDGKPDLTVKVVVPVQACVLALKVSLNMELITKDLTLQLKQKQQMEQPSI
jgi:GTP cyclohydrolase I